MHIEATALDGVLLIEPEMHHDQRGHLFESWHANRYAQGGAELAAVLETHATSVPGTLRGLHYQLHRPQAKLVRVLTGEVLDVAVDLRRSSPTFGRWIAITLSALNRRQIYIPAGFAHGVAVPQMQSEIEIKYSGYPDHEDARGIIWNDPTLAIEWGLSNPILSPPDAHLPRLSEAELPA